MNVKALFVLVVAAGFSVGTIAANDDKKGHGAGGVRAEHASETGIEKGKAWAGSREKDAKEQTEEETKGDKKEKKQKGEKDKSGGGEMEQKLEQTRERLEVMDKKSAKVKGKK